MGYASQKQLFKVVTPGALEPAYFQSKIAAKGYRNSIRESGPHAVVSRGPDHWRGESYYSLGETRGTRRKSRGSPT